jgi:hypothetical protein
MDHRAPTSPRPYLLALLLLTLPCLALQGAQAQQPAIYQVRVTNLTRGQILAPPVAITHTRDFQLFHLGAPASPGLAAMAEDAVTDTLFDELGANPEVLDFASADGPVMPGATAVVEVKSLFPHDLITVTQMLVTTNDAFFAAGGAPGPRGPQERRLTFYANAYDAGSEANTEDCATIPGPPCGNPMVRDTAGAEGFVHVHAGIHGIGDLDAAQLDWRNPVAKVTVVRLNP